MTNSGTWSTSTSLLNRIKQNDPQAWERFTHVYTPLVYTWGRRQGLNQQDAGDLVQDVFTRVFQYIQSFEPDNFRGWLWMVTRNQIHKMAGQNPVILQASGGSQAYDQLNELPADQEFSVLPDEGSSIPPWQSPGNNALVVSRALETIRDDFSATTWTAFWQTSIENFTAKDVAQRLGMTSVAVRHAKFRVLRRLKEEVGNL